MKTDIKRSDNKIFGIDLIPENDEEIKILKRFWDGGVKVNGYGSDGFLQLTFADLIENKVTDATSASIVALNYLKGKGMAVFASEIQSIFRKHLAWYVEIESKVFTGVVVVKSAGEVAHLEL